VYFEYKNRILTLSCNKMLVSC